MGFANCARGTENHLVNLRNVWFYQVPPITDEGKKYKKLSKEEIEEGEKKILEYKLKQRQIKNAARKRKLEEHRRATMAKKQKKN